MRLAVLTVPITGCPGPTRLRGQGDQPPQIGNDAKITDRRSPARRRGQPVIKAEEVEAGRRASTPRGQLWQPLQRNALHARDAGIVHERGRDHTDIVLDQGSYKPLRVSAAGLPFGDVHGITIGLSKAADRRGSTEGRCLLSQPILDCLSIITATASCSKILTDLPSRP